MELFCILAKSIGKFFLFKHLTICPGVVKNRVL